MISKYNICTVKALIKIGEPATAAQLVNYVAHEEDKFKYEVELGVVECLQNGVQMGFMLRHDCRPWKYSIKSELIDVLRESEGQVDPRPQQATTASTDSSSGHGEGDSCSINRRPGTTNNMSSVKGRNRNGRSRKKILRKSRPIRVRASKNLTRKTAYMDIPNQHPK